MKINLIMPKVCATIVTINMEEPKSHGIVPIKNYMPLVCAKIVI